MAMSGCCLPALAEGPETAVARPAALLCVENLGFSFSNRSVLDGVDLQVQPGEIVALLGPNGSGKSTLIRAICGRLQPDSGKVSVAGLDPHANRRARAAIGLVPQQIALYPHLSVAENVHAFGRLGGVDRKEIAARAARVLEICELETVASRRAGELSGGWKRRTNIACALAHAPQLLVLDEPTVGIDPPARRAIEALLQRLAGDGIGILMTGHDLGQLERLAQRAAFLVNGAVAVAGPPRTLIEEYFDDRRECGMTLEQRPSQDQAGRLARAGLAPVGEDDGNGRELRWGGLVDESGLASAERLLEGLAVAEWQVRRPGLDSLWRHLYDQPLYDQPLYDQAYAQSPVESSR